MSCGRRFATVGDYIRATRRLGRTISYDADAGDWKAQEPMGIFALANCTCGTTLALSSQGMPVETVHAVLEWLRVESDRRQITPVALMEHVRNEIRKLALAAAGQGDT